MPLTTKVQNSGTFEIESYGHGFAFSIVRRADGKTVFLQGDDAVRLGRELERTTQRFTDDEVVEKYFEC